MGLELPRKAVATFKKAVDRAKIAMLTGDLFTLAPTDVDELVQIDLDEGADVNVGEELLLRHADGVLWACRLNFVIGRIADPPQQLQRAVKRGCHFFSARIVRFHKLAGIAEATAS